MAKDKPAAKPAAAAEKPAKPKKPKLTKTQFFQEIAAATDMPKADVVRVFEAMHALVHKNLGPKGPGEITLPGLVKLSVTRTKAVKGGKTAINPFTKEEYKTKDKPAKTKLKARGAKSFLESLGGK
jgi:nucleoid DNA-binding protein